MTALNFKRTAQAVALLAIAGTIVWNKVESKLATRKLKKGFAQDADGNIIVA